MQKRPLPLTDLDVSVLCLGTMSFGTPLAEPDAVGLCHRALDWGINFFDTANSYEGYSRIVGSAGGVGETILGAALQGRRDQAVVATKVGMKIGPGDTDQGLSPAHINREVERSLRRLATDYVDLYYLHKPDPGTPLLETIRAMDALVAAGKIRHWGISNFNAVQTAELLQLCDEANCRRPIAVQPAYSLLNRGIEADLLPLCSRERLAAIPYQVLQGGLLTGKYSAGDVPPPQGSRLAEKPEWLMPMTAEVLGRLTALEAEAARLGRSLLSHALHAALQAPAVASLVVGAKSVEQLATLIAAVGDE